MDIKKIVQQQNNFFNTNRTKDVTFRIEQLKKIKQLVQENEELFFKAIYTDFKKSKFDAYLSEFSLFYSEINLAIKKVKKWSKHRRVSTDLTNFPGKSYIVPEPLGTILVIGAWNYPIQLSLVPVTSAIAAGNNVILKPSELPSQTSKVLAKIINNHFPADFLHVIEGGINETTQLLECDFDKIFFTGSIPVGKIVYQAAAKKLIPVTLELGGKSPTFVFADCDIKTTAKRLVWAKYFNAGQTCVSPDYVLVEKSIETDFLAALKNEIEKYHPNETEISENYVQIINHKNFDRVANLIATDKIYCGGYTNREERLIAPTVLHSIDFDDEVMKDEIFGPVLPVISFTNIDEAIKKVKQNSKPLACYVYSKNQENINKIINEVSFGGGAINDSMMHLSNHNLPFGGVGFSGIGNYHGKAGFNTFTHDKSILHKPFWGELPIKYTPYSSLKLKIIKKMLG